MIEHYINILPSGGAGASGPGMVLDIEAYSDTGFSSVTSSAIIGNTIYLEIDVQTAIAPYEYVFTIKDHSTEYTHISSGPTLSYECGAVGEVTFGGYVKDSVTASAYTLTEKTVFVRPVIPEYTRPSDWLTYSTINTGEEVIYAIHAVFTQSHNYVAFEAQGDYTVDWGNGDVINYASGVTAENDLSWGSYSATASVGDNGTIMKQAMITITPQAGNNLTLIDFSQAHSNVTTGNAQTGWLSVEMSSPTCSTFDVYSGSIRHLWLKDFTWYGTNLVTNWDNTFRQSYALEKLIIEDLSSCTSALRSFSECARLINFNNGIIDMPNVTSARYTFYVDRSLVWIESVSMPKVDDVEACFSQCTSLQGFGSIDFGGGNTTNVDLVFQTNYSLVWVPVFDTSNSNVFNYMFGNCWSLVRIPELDTSNATSMSDFVVGCRSIIEFPPLDTSSNLNFTRFFDGCHSLRKVPDLVHSQATQCRVMFRACYSLVTLPKLEFPLITDADAMFSTCYSLKEIDITFTVLQDSGEIFSGCFTLHTINDNWTNSVSTDFASQYSQCYALKNVPQIDTSNGNNFQNMFYLSGANNFPVMDMSSTTTLYRMFYSCSGLEVLDFVINTGSVTNFRGFVRGCYTVSHIKNIDWSSCTNTTNLFLQAYNLRRIEGCNIPITFTIADCDFEAAEIDEIFGDLPVVVGQTVTITGNPGAATCDPTIATAKGWAVNT